MKPKKIAGGRPRKFAQNDDGQMVPFPQPDQLVPPAHLPNVKLDEKERRDSIRLLGRIHHRTRASYNDPMAVVLVLDALQRCSPGYFVRASYVARVLNARHEHFYFEAINVGRIIGELVEVGDEAYDKRPELRPLYASRDYKGSFYLVNSEPSTYKWFWKLRKQLLDLSSKVMSEESDNIVADRPLSVWTEIDTEAITE